MIPIHLTPEIKAAEESLGRELHDGTLMHRAAVGLTHAVAEELDRVHGGSVLLLAGPGNNGGDGLFAAGMLAARGIPTSVWRTSSKVHAAAWDAYASGGGRILDGLPAALAALPSTAVVIDAVYGMGSRPGLPADVATFADACRTQGVVVVACDIPSGLNSDSPGSPSDVSFHATRTVTMGAWKAAHVMEPARSRCGRVTLVDIGLPLPEAQLVQWERSDVAAVWPFPDATSDKYSRGVVGLDTGSEAYPGAGVLSAYGAVYAGAGMVRTLGAARVSDEVRRALPNVVGAEGRVQAWVVGSGWGERPDGTERIAELLATGLPLVVDADGLTHLPEAPIERGGVLLTPHAGELASLLGVERGDVTADPVGAVRKAAERSGATVLLKGATQYVAVPDEHHVSLAVPGPAWTAQAGSGDVLAGICGTLLAAGLGPREAAVVGASIQAIAAAAHPGPYPPQDLAWFLPEIIAGLGD